MQQQILSNVLSNWKDFERCFQAEKFGDAFQNQQNVINNCTFQQLRPIVKNLPLTRKQRNCKSKVNRYLDGKSKANSSGEK